MDEDVVSGHAVVRDHMKRLLLEIVLPLDPLQVGNQEPDPGLERSMEPPESLDHRDRLLRDDGEELQARFADSHVC